MTNSLIKCISDSLFCEPPQLETPGRILVTDCYWTRHFPDCAQFFQIGQRYVFVISFKWAPLFQPILEKIRLGSGLNLESILNLLSDRKTFQGLKVEQLQDVFVNSDWKINKPESSLDWWKAYPIDYANWLYFSEFHQTKNSQEDMNQVGIDARGLKSSQELVDLLKRLESKNTIHFVIDKSVQIESDLLLNHEYTIISRQRITWES